MADLTPACCDGKMDLLRKILLQGQTVVAPDDASLAPSPTDSTWDIYYKFLKVVNIITRSL